MRRQRNQPGVLVILHQFFSRLNVSIFFSFLFNNPLPCLFSPPAIHHWEMKEKKKKKPLHVPLQKVTPTGGIQAICRRYQVRLSCSDFKVTESNVMVFFLCIPYSAASSSCSGLSGGARAALGSCHLLPQLSSQYWPQGIGFRSAVPKTGRERAVTGPWPNVVSHCGVCTRTSVAATPSDVTNPCDKFVLVKAARIK